MCRVAHTYRLPVIAVAEWHTRDLIAAVASIVEDTERCTGCGLLREDWPYVVADVSRCAACEARDRLAKSLNDEQSDTAGLKISTFPADDRGESVWARYTREGAEWRYRNRRGEPADA